MARIRTIKPEFWTSEQVVECSPSARLLFVGMWNFADDNGIHPASIKRLKMEIFPADDFSFGEIQAMVTELKDSGLVNEYEHSDGKSYWIITGWKHQKIDRPTYKYPKPSSVKVADISGICIGNTDEHSESATGALGEHSTSARVRNGMEWNGPVKERILPSEDKSSSGASYEPDEKSENEKWLWSDGLIWLRSTSGDTEKSLRSLIGEWLKFHNAEDIRKAIQTAQVSANGKPLNYIVRILNNKRAADKAGVPNSEPVHEPYEDPAVHQWRARVTRFQRDQGWMARHGPEPGESDCRVPAEILKEFGF